MLACKRKQSWFCNFSFLDNTIPFLQFFFSFLTTGCNALFHKVFIFLCKLTQVTDYHEEVRAVSVSGFEPNIEMERRMRQKIYIVSGAALRNLESSQCDCCCTPLLPLLSATILFLFTNNSGAKSLINASDTTRYKNLEILGMHATRKCIDNLTAQNNRMRLSALSGGHFVQVSSSFENFFILWPIKNANVLQYDDTATECSAIQWNAIILQRHRLILQARTSGEQRTASTIGFSRHKDNSTEPTTASSNWELSLSNFSQYEFGRGQYTFYHKESSRLPENKK